MACFRDPDWEIDYFERSLKMSTYLLAIVVSNFKKITQYTDKYKVLVEITARPDAIDANETSYALNDAVKIIDFYSDYFNITYPLKKSSELLKDSNLKRNVMSNFFFLSACWAS